MEDAYLLSVFSSVVFDMENQTELLALEYRGVPQLGENAELFLKRVKPSTSRTYRVAFNAFANYLCGLGEGSIDAFVLKVDAEARRPLAEGKRDYAEEILIGFNQRLQRLGKANKSVRTYLAAVQGLCKYLKVPLTLDYISMPKDMTQVQMHEWDSADDVARFLAFFKLDSYQALGRLMFQSGLSVSDCLSLTWADLEKELGKVSPLLLDFRVEGRSKTGVKFVTFCGRWTIDALLDYLKGKTLYPDSKLFNLTTESVDSYFKTRAVEFMGIWKGKTNPCSPHSLRHGFRSVVHMARVITETDLEAFMGHGSGRLKMESTYTTISVEQWRTIWKLCEPALTPSYLQGSK